MTIHSHTISQQTPSPISSFLRKLWKSATEQPYAQLRRNKFFYVYYDAIYGLLCIAALAVMSFAGWQPIVKDWNTASWIIFPVACYLQFLSSTFIHNAAHGNFPKPVNRLIGELLGLIVVTRFASWQIVHVRHHMYSDDVEKDPHPVGPKFWTFFWRSLKTVEQQLMNNFYDLFGHTPENKRFERRRAWLSYTTNILLIAVWYQFLGPIGFFGYFVPVSLLGAIFLMHFNWSTHNAQSLDQDFRPVNLNHGYYYFGNLLFFGIYMHGNHHHNARAFNPLLMKKSRNNEQVAA